MKLFFKLLLFGLVTDFTFASNWFSRAIYNNWHETELERWLSDNDIPYPSPADRKDLEKIVSENWQSKVAQPYSDWNVDQLKSYLKERGIQAQDDAAENKDSLVSQVKNIWYEKEDKSEDAWSNIKDWIFDDWSDSRLRAFADKYGITVPEPQKKESTLQAIRSSYDAIAKKLGQSVAYPGDWLYETWSDSELKQWLDSRGIPVPQTSSRDKLIAQVRRNARVASLKAADAKASASNSASSTSQELTDKVIESWSDSKLKEFLDKNGVNVPQGSKTTELVAIARKHLANISGNTVASSAKGAASGASASGSSAFGAATSGVEENYAAATDDAKILAQDAFDKVVSGWSDSRLKAYLDSRGVPLPHSNKREELLAAVRLNRHKAINGWSAWTFDTWSTDKLKEYLASSGNKASEQISKKAGATRDQLLSAAQDSYTTASKSSGSAYASVTSYLAQQTDAAKDSVFDSWSESELKNYLDSYGVPVPQGSTRNSLIAWARNQRNYFQYGTTTPQGTLWVKLQNGASWAWDQVNAGRKQAEIVADSIKEKNTYATHRAGEAAQKASDKIKEEL
ncbi:Stress response protein ish1 [Golovinomyces cichoracearum]|uniref:Stress response protein ish1 n=1 Tax=Golovinomyces cichoracearum TaxID=62708 RepID=A0A420IGK7_9PEZI|nr:Stress response protein ish1 [Golovinomyces cichoracearum]